MPVGSEALKRMEERSIDRVEHSTLHKTARAQTEHKYRNPETLVPTPTGGPFRIEVRALKLRLELARSVAGTGPEIKPKPSVVGLIPFTFCRQPSSETSGSSQHFCFFSLAFHEPCARLPTRPTHIQATQWARAASLASPRSASSRLSTFAALQPASTIR